MSSLTPVYGLVASPYQTSVVSFTAFSFGPCHKPAAHRCSTGALWRTFWQGVQQLTGH